MKIALITDLHAEEEFTSQTGAKPWKNWKTLLNDIKERNINQIIFLGDIGSQTAHKQFFESVENFHFKTILGNHDKFSEVVETFRPDPINEKNEWYWSEVGEYFKTIYLDTSKDSISDTQLDFLRAELQTEKDVVLFIHHPILYTNTTPQLLYPLKGADKIKDLLLKHTNQVKIYCGHLHMDDVRSEDHITQTVTPSASMQIKRQSEKAEIENIDFAYRILSINENQIESELVWYNSDQKRLNSK